MAEESELRREIARLTNLCADMGRENAKLREENRALRAMAEDDSWSKELQDALEAIPPQFLGNDYWVNGIRRMAEHGDKVLCPDFETTVRMVAANIHAQGKFYIEIAVDPKTKEVGWTFEPTEREQPHAN